MPGNQLNNLEEQLVEFSLRRYRRPFYRWANAVGWFIFPIIALIGIPAFHSHVLIAFCLAEVALFIWYFALSTRVIGKLAASTDKALNLPANPQAGSKTDRLQLIESSWPVAVILLLISFSIAIATSKHPVGSRSFINSLLVIDISLYFVAFFLAIAASYMSYFAYGDNPWSPRLMRLGMKLFFWILGAFVVYGSINGVN